MEQKKNNYLITLIYFVIFLAYNILVTMLFEDFNTVFWISYGFMLTVFIIHIICVILAFRNISVKAVFFGIPLISLSIYFVCSELFCCLVFMIFKSTASVKTAVLIQGLLLCVFIVIAAISIMARDAGQSADDKIRERVIFIKSLNLDIEMLIRKSTNQDVLGRLKKLSDIIRYSDPMGNENTAGQEKMIIQCMEELKTAFESEDTGRIKELCEQIELLFVERNKKLMILK